MLFKYKNKRTSRESKAPRIIRIICMADEDVSYVKTMSNNRRDEHRHYDGSFRSRTYIYVHMMTI